MEKKIIKIESKDSYGLTWYEHAQAYFGSHRGMRFRIARSPMEDVSLKPAEEKGDALFEVIVWPEPFSFDNTPDDQKVTSTFPFDLDGKEEMVAWLNQMYEERYDEWERVRAKH